MLKKFSLLLIFNLLFLSSFADANESKYNSPNIGSKHSSTQLFGTHKLASSTNKAVKKNRNKPTVGSKQGSTQVFGTHNTSSIPRGIMSNEPKNKPTVGTKQSSTQTFKQHELNSNNESK